MRPNRCEPLQRIQIATNITHPCPSPSASAKRPWCNLCHPVHNSRFKRSRETQCLIRLRSEGSSLTESTAARILGVNLATTNWFRTLPSQRLQVLLTLFPKCFSPFPHGTCSLSGSGEYLALGRSYHQLRTSLPKSTTPLRPTVRAELRVERVSHPPRSILPKRHPHVVAPAKTLQTTKQGFPGFAVCAIPSSFAITEGIIFILYSSTYLYA